MTDTLTRVLAAEPWAIQPDWLHPIWAIATRQPHLSEKTREDWAERNIMAAVGAGAKRLEGMTCHRVFPPPEVRVRP